KGGTMSRKFRTLAGVCVVAMGLGGTAAVIAAGNRTKTQVIREAKDIRPKNVIMLLGDGMGDSEITAARYYHAGAGGHLRMDELPFTREQTTWSVKPRQP